MSNAYASRVVDVGLTDLMESLSAISIDGPKGVGKTATAQRRATAVFRLDEAADREIVHADPTQLDRQPGTVLIDEWQRLPSVWDYVRRRVDEGADAGRYLLTGSATPAGAPIHSGAGRIVSVRMRPMSLAERAISIPSVSVAELIAGERADVNGVTSLTLTDYARETLASGFPGIRPLTETGRRAQLRSYLDRIVERDFPDQGLQIRRPQTLRAWLAAYAAATSTTTSYNSLLRAATPGEVEKPAKTTTIAYRDVLAQLWLLDPVPGWVSSRSPLARLAEAPKHHLADPALAATLLGLDVETLLSGTSIGVTPRPGSFLGGLFESLVTLSVRVYAQGAGAETFHLRTRNGDHEVDLILERPDGRILALEVKLSATVNDHDVRHLSWLREQLGADLLDSAVITTGARAYRRADGIAVIPAGLLGP